MMSAGEKITTFVECRLLGADELASYPGHDPC